MPQQDDAGSSRGAGEYIADGLGCVGRDCGNGPRGNLGPALAHPDGLAQGIEKLLLAVIMLPAAAVEELDQMGAPALGKNAPFLRDLVECMRE